MTVLPAFTYDPRGFELDDNDTILPDVSTTELRNAVSRALVHARGGAVQGLRGVETPVYWCGVLAEWPWAHLSAGAPDEDNVISEVLKRARVGKDGTLRLSYAGTPWARSLIDLARQEAEEEQEPVDFGFGGNSEQLELHVMARGVFEIAAELLMRSCRWCGRTLQPVADGSWLDGERSEVCEIHVEGCGACDDGESHPHEPA